MGDIADMLAFDVGDEDGEESGSGGLYEYQGIVQCQYCGKNDLGWGQTDNGWRLCEQRLDGNRIVHECPAFYQKEFIPWSDELF